MVELTIAAIRDHYRAKRAGQKNDNALPYPVTEDPALMPSPNAPPLPPPKVTQEHTPLMRAHSQTMPPTAPYPPQAGSQMPPSQMTNDFDHRGGRVEMPGFQEPPPQKSPQRSPQQPRTQSPPKMRPVKSLIPPSPKSKELPELPPPPPSQGKKEPKLKLNSSKYTNFFSSEEMFNQSIVPRPLVSEVIATVTAEIKARGTYNGEKITIFTHILTQEFSRHI